MTKRKSIARVAQKAQTADRKFRTSDGFQNWIARLGLGQSNQMSASSYAFNYLTRNRTQLEAMYRTSWIIRQAIDSTAEDMTRAGIEFEGTLAPDQLDHLHSCMLDMQVWQRLCDTIRWARLFGGCIAVLLIDGQDVRQPLRLDTIGPNQFKGLLVLDRWLVQPSLTDLITEFGPELGQPKYYEVVADSRALPAMKIHHSRVLRMDGLSLPYYQELVEMGWGQSVIECIHDRVIAFDSATLGAAQLVYKAHLRTIKVPQLREIVATGGPSYEGLVKQVEMMRVMQSNEGITLLDGEDDFQTHSYSFAGLDSVLLQFGQQLSGALQIPLVRLFGQSPAGLNSSGESDLRTYYDNVARIQEQRLRRPLNRLIDVLARSEGIDLPDDFSFKFRPLWMLTESEKADIATRDAAAVGDAYDRGLISQATALKELRQSSHVSGRFTNVTDEDIAAADEEPPKAEDLMSEEEAKPEDEQETEK